MSCKWCGKPMAAGSVTPYCSPKCESVANRVQAMKENTYAKSKPVSVAARQSYRPANKRKTEVDYFDRESWRKMAEEKNARLNNHPHAVKLPKGLNYDQDNQLPA